MEIMQGESGYWRYWGKARADEGSGAKYHLLPYHCLDVAAVGMAWWELSLPTCGFTKTISPSSPINWEVKV